MTKTTNKTKKSANSKKNEKPLKGEKKSDIKKKKFEVNLFVNKSKLNDYPEDDITTETPDNKSSVKIKNTIKAKKVPSGEKKKSSKETNTLSVLPKGSNDRKAVNQKNKKSTAISKTHNVKEAQDIPKEVKNKKEKEDFLPFKEANTEKKLTPSVIKVRVQEILGKEKTPVPSLDSPLLRVKNILVSQPVPKEPEKNPYVQLGVKFNLNVDFCQFIRTVPLTPPEFRLQKINIEDYGAVILTSKIAAEYFFKICQENRIPVSENMKYFCLNEQTAYYLQKFTQYKKRKVFFGKGSLSDLAEVIRKNINEKFLVPVSENTRELIQDFLDAMEVQYTRGVFYRTISARVCEKHPDIHSFDIAVFFTPAGIRSLMENYKNFKQGNLRISAFGKAAGNAVIDAGLRLDIYAPTPEFPSMVSALEHYIKKVNKR